MRASRLFASRTLLAVGLAAATWLGTPAASLAEPQNSAAMTVPGATDPDPEIRRLAVAQLAEVGDMDDARRLLPSLYDEDPLVRKLTEAALWQIWSRSGDEATDALFARGMAQLQSAELDSAHATFTQVIALRPDFAEAWNKRATVNFLLERFGDSMRDCDEALKRNPNHFGAMAGYGQMLLASGEVDNALPYLRRALQVNPNMQGVARLLIAIELQREERRRRMV
jgi:tetratricopeptide (TPR) repeat protein